MAYHGAPRYTGDIGVFIKPTAENASRVLQALSAFGFPPTNLRPEEVVDRNKRAAERLTRGLFRSVRFAPAHAG
jgi:hypothetical protein